MSKNDFYRVPADQQAEFNLMIQRANRRIKSSLKFIQSEDIKSENARRALLGDYASPSAWHTEKTPFSRSKIFASEKEYKQFTRHVEQWGGHDFKRSAETIKEGYYKSIISALTTVAIDNGGGGILDKRGRLPTKITKALRGLSLEQISNFFDHADPTEDIEYYGFSSDEYYGVDRDEFIDITMGKINALKELFPYDQDKEKTIVKKKTKKKRKKKKRKSIKRKRRKK